MANITSRYRLTIIVPVYNEQEGMAELEKQLDNYQKTAPISTCVLFVNDGSTDNSLQAIKKACQLNNDFFYISLRENSGLSAALKAGIDTAQSVLIGYIDADLQTHPQDFDLLLEYADQYDLVTGIRTCRQDSCMKRLQSKIANGFRRMITHDNARDTGCPLKVMHATTAKRIPFFNGMHRFLPALVMLQNGKTKQVPIRHYPRVAGFSKYHLRNRLVAPFIDCIAYCWMRRRYINYDISENNTEV